MRFSAKYVFAAALVFFIAHPFFLAASPSASNAPAQLAVESMREPQLPRSLGRDVRGRQRQQVVAERDRIRRRVAILRQRGQGDEQQRERESFNHSVLHGGSSRGPV